MRITSFKLDRGFYCGTATSTRGRQYKFLIGLDGEIIAADRLDATERADGRPLWWIVKPPRSLVRAVLKRAAS
jgi:hypothetical protein